MGSAGASPLSGDAPQYPSHPKGAHLHIHKHDSPGTAIGLLSVLAKRVVRARLSQALLSPSPTLVRLLDTEPVPVDELLCQGEYVWAY